MAPPSPDEEQSFKRMWEEAKVEFQKVTKRSLARSNNQTLDGVWKDLETKYEGGDEESSPKKKKIKELAGNVITFINLLGGIAAQGASVVFGPAGLCFNALQFLIDIPARVGRFYDSLARLFEETSTFMKEFKIYQRAEEFVKVDFELRLSTHKVMICFVEICALSISILDASKWKKFAFLTKLALFDDDSRVTTKLEEFKRLVEHKSRIADAVTLEHVLRSEKDINDSLNKVFAKLTRDSEQLREANNNIKDVKKGTDILVAAEINRDSETRRDEQIKDISKKLGVDHKDALRPLKDFDNLRSRSVPNTGNWLQEVDAYKSWMTVGSKSHSILLLSGDAGTGKSRLISAIADQLRSKYKSVNNISTRVSIACYAFNSVVQKDIAIGRDSAGSGESLSFFSMKSLSLQLAEQDTNYLKDIWTHLEHKDSSFLRYMVLENLAKELLFPLNINDDRDDACFLLFDNISYLPDAEAARLLQAVFSLQSPRIRIAITTTETFFGRLSEQWLRRIEMLPSIKVEEHNESDMVSYIRYELENNKILSGDATAILRIVNSIMEKLPAVAEGNFSSANHIIERIVGAIEADRPEKEVEDLISKTTLQEQANATKRLVSELNNKLNNTQIEQMSVLLNWVIYGFRNLSVDQLRAALLVHTQSEPWEDLEKRLKEHYSDVFEIRQDDASMVVLKDPELRGYFLDTERSGQKTTSNESDNEPTISVSININRARISQVQRFFWDLSEKAVLERFTFDQSLLSSQDTRKISANPVDGHMTIIRQCFEIIFEEPNDGTKALVSYATNFLFIHLDVLGAYAAQNKLTLEEKMEIGANLVSLLSAPEIIERHIDDRWLREQWWMNEDSGGIRGLFWWIHDKDAMSGVSRRERAWVKQVASLKQISPLQDITVMIAKQWLCERKHNAKACFLWIDSFIEALEGGSDYQSETDKQGSLLEQCDMEDETDNFDRKTKLGENLKALTMEQQVQRAARWSEEFAGCNKKNAIFHERLGYTYLRYKRLDLAKESFFQAKQLPPFHRTVFEGLAEVYLATNNIHEAIYEINGAIELTKADDPSLAENLYKLSCLQRRLKKYDEAILSMKEAIKLQSTFYRAHFKLTTFLIESGRLSDALDHLRHMSIKPSVKGNHTHLGDVFLNCCLIQGFINETHAIFKATGANEIFQVILETIESMINRAQRKKSTSKELVLTLCRGVAFMYCKSAPESTESAIVLWKKCLITGTKIGDNELYPSIKLAYKYIVRHYFTLCLASGHSPAQLEKAITELKQMIESASIFPIFATKMARCLGSFYNFAGEPKMARKVLLKEMTSAMDLLSDDDPENDENGYCQMAHCLAHSGDHLHALSAWSLVGPSDRDEVMSNVGQNEARRIRSELEKNPAIIDTNKGRMDEGYDGNLGKQKRSGRIRYRCDGDCGTYWTYADDIYDCTVCADVQFCAGCFDKLPKGELQYTVCSLDHHWLHVPPWSDDEYGTVGKNNVRIEGEFINGKREGGRIVPIEEWINSVRDLYGIRHSGA